MTDLSPETSRVASDCCMETDKLAEILCTMSSLSPPELSPLKETPRKRKARDQQLSTPPSAQPRKRLMTSGTDLRTFQNGHAKARAASTKADQAIKALGKHLSKQTCPPGLRYRPDIRCSNLDDMFKKGLESIVAETQQKTISLIVEFHRRSLEQHLKTQREIVDELSSDDSQREFVNSKLLSYQKSKRVNNKSSKKNNKIVKDQGFVRKADLKDVIHQIFSEMKNVNDFTSVNKSQCETYKSVSPIIPLSQTREEIKVQGKTKANKRSFRDKNRKSLEREDREKFLRNTSKQTLTDSEVSLLSKGLKFVPTPEMPRDKSQLANDFKQFARRMRLKYLFSHKKKSKIHPFYVKSNWQPPRSHSRALETFLAKVSKSMRELQFSPVPDNLSPSEREALRTLRSNKSINIKKADKGTTTVIMDTQNKASEGLEELNKPTFYQPIDQPMVDVTASKVRDIVDELLRNDHIDNMTHKFLSTDQDSPRIPEFYTLTKIHKKIPVGRPIMSGSSGPTERISSFVDSLLQPIAKKQKSYIKDTTDFINFVESIKLPENAILVSFDVTALYTNIPQEEGINIVCSHYDKHYGNRKPIPTEKLRTLMSLILEENSFSFHGDNYLQTSGIAMGTKMAVAFANIFMADFEERLLQNSDFQPEFWKRFVDDIISAWLLKRDEIEAFLNYANSIHPTIKFTAEISDTRVPFLDTFVFKGTRFQSQGILDIQTHFKPTETFQYLHFTSSHPLGVKKGFVKGEALRLLRTNSNETDFLAQLKQFEARLYTRGYPEDLVKSTLTSVTIDKREASLARREKCGNREILPFVTTYNPAVPNIKDIFRKHWHHVANDPFLSPLFKELPIIAYRKEKSLKDMLVRAKIPT